MGRLAATVILPYFPPVGGAGLARSGQKIRSCHAVKDSAESVNTANHESLPERLHNVRERITRACEACGRDPGEVQLLAVSKGHSAERIQALADLGQKAFGENYLQEARDKMDRFEGRTGLEWHFIGALQSNKTRAVAERFDWVHTVDRAKIARRLDRQRPEHLPPLSVCLQVNIDDDPRKAGCQADEVFGLAETVAGLEGLRLRGLMAMPRASEEFESQRKPFRALRILYEELQARGHAVDTLSMGMSGDLEAAVTEGATLLRVGSALFGPRPAG